MIIISQKTGFFMSSPTLTNIEKQIVAIQLMKRVGVKVDFKQSDYTDPETEKTRKATKAVLYGDYLTNATAANKQHCIYSTWLVTDKHYSDLLMVAQGIYKRITHFYNRNK